jgi:hypothetical protein
MASIVQLSKSARKEKHRLKKQVADIKYLKSKTAEYISRLTDFEFGFHELIIYIAIHSSDPKLLKLAKKDPSYHRIVKWAKKHIPVAKNELVYYGEGAFILVEEWEECLCEGAWNDFGCMCDGTRHFSRYIDVEYNPPHVSSQYKIDSFWDGDSEDDWKNHGEDLEQDDYYGGSFLDLAKNYSRAFMQICHAVSPREMISSIKKSDEFRDEKKRRNQGRKIIARVECERYIPKVLVNIVEGYMV